jgi:hypothetical protein
LGLVRSRIAEQKIFLAKHYNPVMIAPLRLITAASLKWMKWMAAAWWSGLRLLFCTDVRRHDVGGQRTSPSSSSPRWGHPKSKANRNFHPENLAIF